MKYFALACILSVTLILPVSAQDKSNVSVRVVNDVQAAQNIAGDETEQYMQRYNTHNVKDLLLSEAIIVGVEFMAVVAFTMIYLDVTRRRDFKQQA